MPFRLPSLNLGPVGLPRIGIGADVRPRNPMLPPGSVGVPPINSLMPQTPQIPRLNNMGAPMPLDTSSSGSDLGVGDALSDQMTRTNLSTDKTANPDATPIIKNEDGSINWMAILAPLLGAGLGAAMGGRRGALQGAVGGFAGVGEGMASAAKIRREQQNTAEELGIKRTEAAARAEEFKGKSKVSEAQVKAAAVENYIATGQDPGNVLTLEEKTGIAEKESQKLFTKWSEKIESASDSGSLSGYPAQVQSESHLSPAQKDILIQSVGKRIPVVKGKEITDTAFKESGIQSGVSLRLEREALIAQNKQEHELKRQVYANNAADNNTPYESIVRIFPDLSKEEYNILKRERQSQKFYDKSYSEEIKRLSLINPNDLDVLIKADQAAQRATEKKFGTGPEKVEELINILQKIPADRQKEELDRAKISSDDKNVVAKRLGIGYDVKMLQKVTVQRAIDDANDILKMGK